MLARSLHRDIAALAKRLESAATAEEDARHTTDRSQAREYREAELVAVVAEIKKLLDRIDRDAPLIQLAITGSGESLSSSIPPGISPSRFLQASAFLNLGDTQFASDPSRPVQIGPSLTLSLYMLFVGHSSSTGDLKGEGTPVPRTMSEGGPDKPHAVPAYGYVEGERKPIWKEVLHKCRVRLCRTPLDWAFDAERGFHPKTGTPHAETEWIGLSNPYSWPDEFAYSLEIVEDLDDGRVHDEVGSTTPTYDGIARAGLRECIPIYQISKIFYTDTGKLLNIGDDNGYENHPVLLLKRDDNTTLPSGSMEQVTVLETDSPLRADISTRTASDEQADVDRQLLDESRSPRSVARVAAAESHKWTLPPNLDPEWIALEVFVDDGGQDEDSYESDSDAGTEGRGVGDAAQVVVARSRVVERAPLDAKLITQIRNISIRSSLGSFPGSDTRPPSRDSHSSPLRSPEQMVASSPFGNIASSLSLLEMLIRLTSLQETQQAAHLSIPDHILSFFLEEASTTGLRGEERRRIRDEAKRRVGFDPYTDTPTR